MTKNILSPNEIVDSFKNEFKTKIADSRIEKHVRGLKKTEFYHIWIKTDRKIIKDIVKHLIKLEKYPHLAVLSGYDNGKNIVIVYHFSIYFGLKRKEININISVDLPKSDPTIDTITDLIPGALISEQEKQEMLGIKVNNIPKDSRVFISEDYPEDTYPWRKDEKGPNKTIRNLHEVKK
ncbi:MAG: NADH-quinone oxidoreductase subunit C [Candidatus Lokiarchaeia archaeon]|nr:NADH-quinone oxidoreductase subunit C [Candidatus Lokiarchaeia archaeon]